MKQSQIERIDTLLDTISPAPQVASKLTVSQCKDYMASLNSRKAEWDMGKLGWGKLTEKVDTLKPAFAKLVRRYNAFRAARSRKNSGGGATPTPFQRVKKLIEKNGFTKKERETLRKLLA